MKFPSVKGLVRAGIAVFQRFPVEVVFALIGTVAATVNTELKYIDYEGQRWCWRLIMLANLGLLLSLAATLFSESRQLSRVQKLTIRLAAAVLAVLIGLLINPYLQRADTIRFFLLSLAFHLLVAVASFMKAGMVQGFWQFNKTLFLRFLTGVLYSAVLFAGLAAAIAAINFLFNFEFETDTYIILWVWIAGMFNTVFFLAGVPSSYQQLDEDYSYPKGLKVFTQFVLIPLATVYVSILLAYEIKILVQWHLPKGLVSSLILGYAVFGILALLLVYPIRNQQENKWIKTYARNFYALLLPLLILLFVAVGVRVSKYGVTEFRYFLIVLAFWLLAVSLYFLFSVRQNIKLIPFSLGLLTLLAVYGPQSAFNVARNSQLSILENIFKRNKAYQGGLLAPVNSNISKRDGNRAVAVLDYLIKHNDLTVLQPYFKQDLQEVTDSLGRIKNKYDQMPAAASRYVMLSSELEWIKKRLNVDGFSGYWNEDREDAAKGNKPVYRSTIIALKNPEFVDVSGYRYLQHVEANTFVSAHTVEQQLIEYTYKGMALSQLKLNNALILKVNGHPATFNLKYIADSLLKQPDFVQYLTTPKNQDQLRYEAPVQKLSFVKKAGAYEVTLRINSISLYKHSDDKGDEITYVSAIYLIR